MHRAPSTVMATAAIEAAGADGAEPAVSDTVHVAEQLSESAVLDRGDGRAQDDRPEGVGATAHGVGPDRRASEDLDDGLDQLASCRASMRWARSSRACAWSARRRPPAWRVASPCSVDQATSARVPSASGKASLMASKARLSGSGVFSSAANASPEGIENIASYTRGWSAANSR